MSEDYRILGGTPNVLFEDAVEFMQKRADIPCPACGHTKWDVTAAFDGNPKLSWGLTAVNVTTFYPVSGGSPVVTVECRKCAFLRMHHLGSISKWIEAGKPEFKDDE